MKVTKTEFIISAVKPVQYPDTPFPEFALAGRSNVGKSSFINKTLNRKALARISSKPGKTQLLNFFNINDLLYFVDVPGYGYAKVSKTERAAWGKMIETYITTREQLQAVILLVDLRHAPSKDDILMYDFLKHHHIPAIIVATKADKIKRSQLQKHIKVVREALQINRGDDFIVFSSETGQGKEEAWAAIESFLEIEE